ncbi:hypothetical protein Chor_012513 [Crotalus horridus]
MHLVLIEWNSECVSFFFQEPSLYTVKAILILDNDGDRLFAKYYDDTYPTVKEQKAFEKNIFSKTHRTDSEIALLEGLTVVYKSSIDLYFYVIGSSYENELMLMAVLNCLFDSLSQMLRKNVEKRALLENMEGLFLAVDEIVDGGVILESDPQQVLHRVAVRVSDLFFLGGLGRMSLSQNRQSHRYCNQQRNRLSGPFCDEEPCGISSIDLLSPVEPPVCLSCTDQIIT